MTRARTIHRMAAAALAAVATSSIAHAQLSGDLLRGQVGLAAGTQPPPGLVLSGFAYAYHTSDIIGPDGNGIPSKGSMTMWAVPGVNAWYVRPLKMLGQANYGAVLSMWGTAARADFPRLDIDQSTYGFGDMYLKPIELGWHRTYVDIITGFALWIPTGRYSPGGNDNTGQGQWGYEFSAGATVWFDQGHHLNFGTQIFYDIYSPRRGTTSRSNTQLHTGNILTLMGGLGYQILGGGLNVGIPYFLQFKVTEDTLPPGFGGPFLPALQADKDWSVGLGVEADFFWCKTDGVTVRFMQGFSGSNTTNGQSYFLFYNHVFSFGGS